jgi:SagB-type dehydrogenase family enzyme
MRRITLAVLIVLVVAAQLSLAQAPAQGTAVQQEIKSAEKVSLPPPAKTGGMSLNEALARRRSVRSFTSASLTPQEVAQLLWSAQGITGDKGQRTAPSAHAWYFLRVYLANSEGLFEYLPASHELQKVSGKDLRASLSPQAAVSAAPAVLIVAGDYDRAVQQVGPEMGTRFVVVEAGHAAQNVLLQATALGLGAVPVGGIQPKQAQATAGLPANSVPIYLIPVGHPK